MKSALGFLTMIESLTFLTCAMLFCSTVLRLQAILCLHRVPTLPCVVFSVYWLVCASAHTECDAW